MTARRCHALSLCAAFLAAALLAPSVSFSAEGAARVLKDERQHLRLTWNSITLSTRDLRPGAFDETRAFAGSWHMLSFCGDNLGGTGISIAMGAWAMAELAAGTADGHVGDVVYGRFGWRNASRTVYVRAGRLSLYVGAPRYLFVDGAAATVFLPAGLRADAYYGFAVNELFHDLLKAPVAGGRLAYVDWRNGHIGLAFQDVSEQAEMMRRTVGIDFALRRFDPIRLTGHWAHDLLRGGLQEARIDAIWHINKWLDVFTRGELRDPLAWLPRHSIFHAFVARTDGQAGVGFDLRTPGALAFRGHYNRMINDDGVPDGYDGELETRLNFDKHHRNLVGLVGGMINNGDNGYYHARAFARATPIRALTVSLDLDGYRFLRKLNGHDVSMLAALAVQWHVLPGLNVTVDGRTWQNPYFERQAMAMLHVHLGDKLFWRVDKAAAAAKKGTAPSAKAKEEDDEDEDEDEDEDDEDKDEDEDEDEDDKKDGDKKDDKPAEKKADTKAPEGRV